MTKQQGVLFVPLVIVAGLLDRQLPARAPSKPARLLVPWFYFLAGFPLVVVPILYWDSLRWAVAPSPWDLGARNVGAVTLTNPAQWGERLRAWFDQAWYLQASYLAWLAVGGIVIAGLVVAIRHRAAFRGGDLRACWRSGPRVSLACMW